MAERLSLRLPGNRCVVAKPCPSLAALLLIAACAAPVSASPTICDIIDQPESYDGRSLELDLTFTANPHSHSYVLANGCGRAAMVDIDRDRSGENGGPSLFWELIRARDRSTPLRLYGISARATVRVRLTEASESGFVLDVEAISAPRLVPIPAPSLPPPREDGP